jgi:tetratricopeptide (TPR) repeat protein
LKSKRIQTVDIAPAAPWKIRVALAVLVLAVGVVYANSFQGPFVFDDFPSIVANPSIKHLFSLQVLAAPPDAVTTTGRPVVNLTLAINYALGGLAVEGYHLTNLAIHLLAALTLFGLIRRTLFLPRLSTTFAAASTGLALTASLLWALHPLQTESVTYIVQRTESLVGLFYLLTLYCLVRAATSARSRFWSAAAVVSCALGMGSKEVMVSAPVLALLYHRTFISGSWKDSLRQRRGLWLGLAATWALLIVAFLSTGRRGGSAGFGLGMTAWQYARTQFGCIVHYLRLAFWPSPLVLDYGTDVVRDASQIVPYALIVFVLLAATIIMLRRRPALGFLGAWFFAILAPTSSVVPLAGQTQAEHRMYLPLAAVVMLVVLAVYQVAARARARRAATAMFPVVALALGWGTFKRNQDYKSDFALWDSVVRSRPGNSRAMLNRGNAYLAKGENLAAIQDYSRSIELTPRYAKPYNGRGSAFRALGRYHEAIRDYDKAILLDSKFADAFNNRGLAHAAVGQLDAAIRDHARAIELLPDSEEAYFNRARALDSLGKYDAAIRDYDKVIALRPDYADAYNNRGGAFEAMGQTDAALKDYDKAIALRPDLAEAYTNRGNLHQGRGQLDAAIKDYDKAIALRPELAAAYYNRALAHSASKAYDRAWADLREFRRLGGTPHPSFVEELTRNSGRSE